MAESRRWNVTCAKEWFQLLPSDENSTAINVDLRDDSARTTRVCIDPVANSFRLMVVNDTPNYSRISKSSDKQLHEILHYIRYSMLCGFADTYSRLCSIKIICNALDYTLFFIFLSPEYRKHYFTVFEKIKYYRFFVDDIACCNLLSRWFNVLMKNNLSRKKALGASNRYGQIIVQICLWLFYYIPIVTVSSNLTRYTDRTACWEVDRYVRAIGN